MARKAPPKYPNQQKAVFRRFIRQALLLSLILVVAWAVYVVVGPGKDSAQAELDALAESLMKGSEFAEPIRDNFAPLPENELPSFHEVAPPIPVADNIESVPVPEAAPDVEQAGTETVFPEESGTSGGGRTRENSGLVPPFAGKSLLEIAAVLGRRYAGRTPVEWAEHMPGITSRFSPVEQAGNERETRRAPVVALTLDACGGRKGASFDAGLIEFLRENAIPATLFITSLWMRANPDILADLAADPLFEIGAHGARHRPCSVNGKSVYGISGTASFAELVSEVEGNARDLEKAAGKRPRWFRSGTAYYDDIAVSAIHDLGLGIAGYSIAGDEGATLPAARVAEKVLSARHGDILLLHMNKPQSGAREGLKKALPMLIQQGFVFVRLSDIAP